MDLDNIIGEAKPSQNIHELKSLLDEVKLVEPLIILEIGVHLGGSIKVWKEVFDPALIIGVDLKIPALDLPDVLLIEADSHNKSTLNQIKKRIDNGEVDFLFIDGDHSYEGVKQDFLDYSPLVSKGGLIAFHDIKVNPDKYPGGEVDVMRFWTLLKLQIETLPEYATWDYKELWDEASGTGTGVVYAGLV